MTGTNKVILDPHGHFRIVKDFDNWPEQDSLINFLNDPREEFALARVISAPLGPCYFVPLSLKSDPEKAAIPRLLPAIGVRVARAPRPPEYLQLEPGSDSDELVLESRSLDPVVLPVESLSSIPGIQIDMNFCYVSASLWTDWRLHRLPNRNWTALVWQRVAELTVHSINKGAFAGPNLRAAFPRREFGEAYEFPVSKGLRELGILELAFLWDYWEERIDKSHARACDVNDLRISSLSVHGKPMQKDNLQRICREAGLIFGEPIPPVDTL